METTGERIKRYREQLNLTQEELANKINTSPQNIYKYEKGIIQNIPLNKINALSKIFDVSPAVLVGWGADPYAGLRNSAQRKEIDKTGDLSDTEKAVITAFRTSNPETRQEILRLLDIRQKTPYTSSIPSPYRKLAAPPLEPLRYKNKKNK